ncbi:hypothetical protein [Mycobacterium vicinigordonae]|uniref:Uncharacterized protein n=1 Tax=Mycobacterium vicinigordonae TaxID=1719132 RepID=A0A7D6IPG1_9MYCO|nr:hypothetical protein [Mycobacterium vicinigordonae]QLL08860.1 hypothetical protein H0P51_08145 [Mycobacterium vicinigordonae]
MTTPTAPAMAMRTSERRQLSAALEAECEPTRSDLGSLMLVVGFDGYDDAVRIANRSIRGLSAVVFANAREPAKSVAGRRRTLGCPAS